MDGVKVAEPDGADVSRQSEVVEVVEGGEIVFVGVILPVELRGAYRVRKGPRIDSVANAPAEDQRVVSSSSPCAPERPPILSEG